MDIEGLSKVDNKILDVIKEEARLTYSEIGARVGLSRVSVKKRMDAMEELGVIKGYRTVLDPTKLPDGIPFVLDLVVESVHYEDVLSELAYNKMIRKIFSLSGDGKIMAEGISPNSRNLEYFTNTFLRKAEGVLKVGCYTVLSTIMDKDGGIPYVPIEEAGIIE